MTRFKVGDKVRVDRVGWEAAPTMGYLVGAIGVVVSIDAGHGAQALHDVEVHKGYIWGFYEDELEATS